ncbi:Uncharacterised protein [Vibrio cholerae]|nr:Uncharacterised protein [Vibrio cholerae]
MVNRGRKVKVCCAQPRQSHPLQNSYRQNADQGSGRALIHIRCGSAKDRKILEFGSCCEIHAAPNPD